MGWCPAGDRSTIDNRRCAKPTPDAGSIHIPSSSGPRWAIAAAMRDATATAVSRITPGHQNPAIPHIVSYFPITRLRARGCDSFVASISIPCRTLTRTGPYFPRQAPFQLLLSKSPVVGKPGRTCGCIEGYFVRIADHRRRGAAARSMESVTLFRQKW